MFQVFIVAVVILISSTFAVFALSRPWVGHVLLGDGAYQTAVAVDSTGAIHVVIADTSLLYATNAGGGWTTTVLDGDHSVFRAVLARDTKDHLHVVEEAFPPDTGVPGEAAMASIRYWTNSAGGWSVTTIDAAGRGASIAIDGSDHIHAAYLGTNGSTTELRHATDAGGVWTSTPVFSWSDSLTSAVATAIAVAPSGAVSITVSYGLFGLIYYLTNSTGSWTRSELTSSADLGGTASFPVDTAPVAIDAAGTVHAAFSVYNRSTNTTSVIHAENSKGNWAWDSVGTTREGVTCSMVLDASGHVHLAYGDSSSGEPTSGVLTYATNAGGGWSRHVVDPNTRSSAGSSIALSRTGNPVIAYVYQEFAPFPHFSPDLATSTRVVTNAIEGWNFVDVLAALAPFLFGELLAVGVAFRIVTRHRLRDRPKTS